MFFTWMRNKITTVSDFSITMYQRFDALLITSLHSTDDTSIFAFNSTTHKLSVIIVKILLFLLVLTCIYFLCMGYGLLIRLTGIQELFIDGNHSICRNNLDHMSAWTGCPVFGFIMMGLTVVVILLIIIIIGLISNGYENVIENDFDIEHKKTYGTFNEEVTYHGL